jgi:hypothetical protein
VSALLTTLVHDKPPPETVTLAVFVVATDATSRSPGGLGSTLTSAEDPAVVMAELPSRVTRGAGRYVNWSVGVNALVPSTVVTVASTVVGESVKTPPPLGGSITVSCELELTVKFFVVAEPKETAVTPFVNPVPAMVTGVPPNVDPWLGLTVEIVGEDSPPLIVWRMSSPLEVDPTAQHDVTATQAIAARSAVFDLVSSFDQLCPPSVVAITGVLYRSTPSGSPTAMQSLVFVHDKALFCGLLPPAICSPPTSRDIVHVVPTSVVLI